MYLNYKVISLCISRAGTDRNFEFIHALHEACIQNNCKLFIYHTCSNFDWNTKYEEGDKAVFDLIDYDITDAVIIFDEAFIEKDLVKNIISRASHHHVPVISVGAAHKHATSFLFNYKMGFEQVVRHVIEHHHIQKTCFIAGSKGNHYSEERISIYKKVLEENGLPFSEDQLYYGDYWWLPTQSAVEEILASGDIPDAILCVNDNTAIAACEPLRDHGLRVPEDIIVTGFDGTLEAQCCTPSITTAKCDLKQAAKEIINTLNLILSGLPTQEQYFIDYTLDVYHSCGCHEVAKAPNIGELLKKASDRFIRYQDDEGSFHDMTKKVINCATLQDFTHFLNEYEFYNTCVVVNNDCLDETVNPTSYTRSTSYDDTMTLLYQSHTDLTDYPMPIRRKDMFPSADYILTQTQNPLLFNALSSYGSAIGYVCFSFLADIDNYCKILQFVTSLNNFITNYRSIRYLKHTAKQMEHMSKRDFMTDLYNRNGFYDQLPSLIRIAKQRKQSLLVATIDMDGLKNINDTYGHEEGDFSINAIVAAINHAKLDQKICGRFGGDEFVVCAVCHDAKEGDIFQQSFLENLNQTNDTAGKPYRISASIGVCIASYKDFDFKTALKESDDKMYIMKIGHPNRRKS